MTSGRRATRSSGRSSAAASATRPGVSRAPRASADRALGEILAAAADVIAGPRGRAEPRDVAAPLDALLHHDRVGARRAGARP